MASPRDVMRQVHQSHGKSTPTPPAVIPVPPMTKVEPPSPPIREAEATVLAAHMETAAATQMVHTQLVEGAQKVYRPGIDPGKYSEKPHMSNVGLFNYDLHEWFSKFSSQNQRKKQGVAITKSTLLEVILDVVRYDIGLEAEGFSSPDELRRFLQSKLNK